MSWFTHLFGMDKDPQAPIKSFIKNAPQSGNVNIDANKKMRQSLLDGSFKRGGKVKKTGVYKLHKDEQVLTKKQAMTRRMTNNEYA